MVTQNIDIVVTANTTNAANNLNKLEKQLRQLQSTTARVQNLMMQFGLNMLFTGMMIKKTFQQIAKSTVDTFMKISAGATPGSQAIMAVGAAFEYLKYSIGDAIGQALLPLLPVVLDLIERFADWVQQNQELVAAIVIGAIVFGTLLMLLGQLLLVLTPVFNLITMLIGPAGMLGLKASILALAPTLAILGAAFLVFALLWITNFNNIQDHVKKFIDQFFALFSSLFEDVAQIVQGFMDIVDGIMTGDWNKILKGILGIVKGFVSAVIKIFLFLMNQLTENSFFLATAFIRVFGTILSIAVGFARNLANIFLTPLNAIIDGINAVSRYFTGRNAMSRVTIDTRGLEGFITGFSNSVANMVDSAKNNVLEMYGLGSKLPQTYGAVDRTVDFVVEQISVYIQGDVSDSSARAVGQEAGAAMARNINMYSSGVTG